MKQTATIISTYAADISGICSAMYELGGMTVMHDASGCNSTYNTHDEPRWYDMDSLVFISGISETEAILGDDEKLIHDTVEAAKELKPRFITLGGTPIPTMIGTDFRAVAEQIERETGIPAFGLNTDGMHSYISGVSKAYEVLANRICKENVPKTEGLSVNILGATPLDFSINGSVRDMKDNLERNGIEVHGIWSMGTYQEPSEQAHNKEDLFQKIETAGAAHVNLVVSSCGLQAAKVLKARFGMPYVIGTPFGTRWSKKLAECIKDAKRTGEDCNPFTVFPDSKTVIIGESVTALSFANALYEEAGIGAKVLCGVELYKELESVGCVQARDEVELIPHLQEADTILADPMYQPICPKEASFVSMPHEAFSGRIYRNEIPNLAKDFEKFIEKEGIKKC